MRGAAFGLLLLLALPLASQTQPPVRVLRTGGLKAETAALLVSGQQGGGLGFAVLPIALRGTGERARVTLVLEIDGSDLLAGQDQAEPMSDAAGRDRNLLRCEIAVYALTVDGAIQGSLAETVEIDLDQLEAEIATSGLRFEGELQLLPGDLSLRVLVRNLATGNAGLKVVPLAVPGPGEPTVLPPLFAALPDSWVSVRSVAAAAEPSPLAAKLKGALPAARPVLVLGRPVTFQLPAYQLATGSSEATVRLTRPGAVEPVASLTAKVGSYRSGSGIDSIEATFTPGAVDPGEYEMSVSLAGAAKPSASLPVILVETGVGDQVWASLEESPAAGAEPAAPGEAARRRRLSRRQSTAFVEKYRAALERLSRGEGEAARRDVAEIELGALSIDAALRPEDLAELEASVLVPLAQADPAAMLPVLGLYRLNYGEALSQKRYLLASHSRQLAFSLAEFVGERGGSSASHVANFLAIFGADILTRTRTSSFSRWAFDRALKLDPKNEATLLCLAIDAERRNALREAIGYLKQLLAHDPAHREARLRLAVSQRRLGDVGSAKTVEQLLTGLVEGEEGDWIAAVAFQELARLYRESAQPDRARLAVEQGLSRLPGDEKLLLLATWDAQRRGQPAEAAAYGERLAPASESEPGPRLRYGSFPETLLIRAERELAAAAEAGRPRLANALAATAAKKRK